MTANETAIRRILRIFVHPAIILSLFLLALNDHILKQHWPSFLTGKLSDFAGLFFFPYLLMFFLLWMPGAKNLPWHQLKAASFALTTFVFTALKLSLAFNTALTNVLSTFGGIYLHFVVDPTDLIALIVLFRSWKLDSSWENELTQMPKRKAYVLIAVASLLTAATSPAQYLPGVYQIETIDGSIYAGVFDAHTYPGLPYNSSNDEEAYFMYAARNQGDIRQWQVYRGSFLPLGLEFNDFSKPIIVCSQQYKTCFRATAEDGIVASVDGGKIWKTYWQLPRSASLFLDKFFPLSDNEIVIFDIAIKDSSEGPILFAAAGLDGVIVIFPDGSWNDVEVEGVGDFPITAYRMFSPGLLLSFEPYLAFIASILLFARLSSVLKQSTQVDGLLYARLVASSKKAILVGSGMLIVLMLVSAEFRVFIGEYAINPLLSLLIWRNWLGFSLSHGAHLLLAPLFLILQSLWFFPLKILWLWHIPIVYRRDLVNRLISIGFFFTLWLPFGLWSSGVFQSYLLAMGIALTISFLFVLAVGRFYIPSLQSLPDEGQRTSNDSDK